MAHRPNFEFVADAVYMSDLILRNILTIPKFHEHVCPTACVGLPGLPPSFRAQVRGLITLLAQGLICLNSGTASSHTKALFDIIIRSKNGGQVIYGRKIVKNIIIYI